MAFSFTGEQRCFIHKIFSRLGRSRSAALVIGYLMWKLKISYREAFAEVSRHRDVLPNFGFQIQLKCFEKNNFEFDTTLRAYQKCRRLIVMLAALRPILRVLCCYRDE